MSPRGEGSYSMSRVFLWLNNFNAKPREAMLSEGLSSVTDGGSPNRGSLPAACPHNLEEEGSNYPHPCPALATPGSRAVEATAARNALPRGKCRNEFTGMMHHPLRWLCGWPGPASLLHEDKFTCNSPHGVWALVQ